MSDTESKQEVAVESQTPEGTPDVPKETSSPEEKLPELEEACMVIFFISSPIFPWHIRNLAESLYKKDNEYIAEVKVQARLQFPEEWGDREDKTLDFFINENRFCDETQEENEHASHTEIVLLIFEWMWAFVIMFILAAKGCAIGTISTAYSMFKRYQEHRRNNYKSPKVEFRKAVENMKKEN